MRDTSVVRVNHATRQSPPQPQNIGLFLPGLGQMSGRTTITDLTKNENNEDYLNL